jgi:hypothetical protein
MGNRDVGLYAYLRVQHVVPTSKTQMAYLFEVSLMISKKIAYVK